MTLEVATDGVAPADDFERNHLDTGRSELGLGDLFEISDGNASFSQEFEDTTGGGSGADSFGIKLPSQVLVVIGRDFIAILENDNILLAVGEVNPLRLSFAQKCAFGV